MCAINKCLLYAFLCLAIFCEIDSKGQIPNDGVINIDDTLKGEVIEGSGRPGEEDDVDQEESSGGLEDDEDTPLLSSMTPGVPSRGRPSERGRSLGADSFEPGSGDGRQGNDDDRYVGVGGVAMTTTTTTTATTSSLSSSNNDEILRRRFFASSPPPPPFLPPASPSSTLTTRQTPATTTPTTTTTSTTIPTTATALPPRPSYRNGDDEDDDSFGEGSGIFPGGRGANKDKMSSLSTTTTTTTTTTATTTTTTTTPPRRQLVDPVDYPEEDVFRKKEEEVYEFGSRSDDDDDEDSVVAKGSGHSPVDDRERGEVSKPPTTVYKPTKPNPTFVTRHEPNKKKGQDHEDHETNMIHHGGGTGYDEKKINEDDYSNEIPFQLGKAVMVPKEQKTDDSLWKQPGILAVCIIGAAVVGLLCAVLLVMFIVYRMRKKDEGSYDLDETTKRSPRINGYQRTNQNEFYA